MEGDAKTALAAPNSVVITNSTATKYFKNENPLAKVLTVDIDGAEYPFKVTGVVKDVPKNSHFRFDFLVSLETFEWSRETNWFMNNHITYLLLQKGISKEQMEEKLAEGRFFSLDFPTDTSAIVINEEAVRYFGLTNPLGKHIYIPYKEKEFQIIGVIKDIHYESLHKKVKRMGLVLSKTIFSDHDRYIFARISSANIPKTLDSIKDTWNSLSPELAFEYSFLDEELEKLYRQEINTGKIVASFSFLAILISCLGIFGLAAFMAEQKTKEIGIRKILGAKLPDVILLLSKEFMKWILIANLIVWPVGFLIMKRWLENFAYRTNIGIGVFLLTGGLATSIAIMTISYQVKKVATANPVDSLRYE